MADILPREGLYIDPIASLVKKTILHPVCGGLLIAYSTLNPAPQWPGLQTLAVYTALLGLGIRINEFVSQRSRNNWVSGSTWDWRKEIVVVTGASSGIGSSVVQRLASDGVRVVAVDVEPLPYDEENKLISYFRCDLSDEAEIRKLCASIWEEVGHPTVLVNNAGLSRGRTIANGTYHDVGITLRTNLLAPILLTKEFLPHMIRRNHGHVFNIASLSAYLPPAGLADYSASKAGLVAFHEALGQELKYCHSSPNIRTSLAVLSFTNTPLFKGETNLPRFLFPLIHVDTVGDVVVDALYSGYGRTVFLPGLCRFFSGIRGAPEWLQTMILGGSQSLKVDFQGRQKIDSVTGKLA